MLVFQDLEGLTEVFGGMSTGMSGRKLPLWAEFSFLTLALGTQKSLQRVSGTIWEVSGESPESVERVFSDCSRDLLETFLGSGARAPERRFRDIFGISGPKGPRETSVRGRLAPNFKKEKHRKRPSNEAMNCSQQFIVFIASWSQTSSRQHRAPLLGSSNFSGKKREKVHCHHQKQIFSKTLP